MEGDQPLWGGRFEADPAPDLLRLTTSIGYDIELLQYDLAATRAHARGLVRASLLEETEVEVIDRACADILSDHEDGSLQIDLGIEDVHSLVERELTNRLGELGRRIHAGRSRNDLVATDLRLWCRDASSRLLERICLILDVLAKRAASHVETVMPGYTHLQRAQPVSLAFHLLAHAFAFARDGARFSNARSAADSSVLGAGALAGTTLELDPSVPAQYLGFSNLFDNAMDAVSDRDFACDLVYASALCMLHLSRLAEEVILWTSAEFGFARLSDEWSTGSSMMPQKRNPDVAELTRGRAAAGIGDLTGLLALIKGLPLAYNRDLQEDKPIVFRAVAGAENGLEGMTQLLRSLDFDTQKMEAAAATGWGGATDIAEALVARGVPFREAHEATGRLIAAIENDGLQITPEMLEGIHPRLEEADLAGDPLASVSARSSHGATGPGRTEEQIGRIRQIVSEFRQNP